jgi:hypothetical protein
VCGGLKRRVAGRRIACCRISGATQERKMRGLVAALTVAGSLVLPALAVAMDDMSCADFGAMDPDGRMAAVTAMDDAMAAGGGMMAAGDAMMAADPMTPDARTEAITTACAEHPDMMLGETMQGITGE